MPLLSIIVPVYNTEKYLRECLNSIVNQTLEDIEIIIVNDCTEDDSENIILDYLKKDNRISYIKHEKNLGLGGARNTGIKTAKGKWIAFVDSDDFIEINCYKKMIELIDKYNSDLCIFSAINFDDITGKRYYDKYYDVEIINGSRVTAENISKIASTTWNKIFKLKDIIDNKIFFPEYLKHEDDEFWYKYASLLKPITVGDKSTYYHYRQRKDSIVAGNTSRKDLPTIFYNIYNFLYNNGLADEYKSTLIPKISWSYNWYNELKDEYRECFLSDMKELLQKMNISDDDWNSMDNKAKELYFSNPKLSIIIPVYNTEKYLSRCLDSVINQTYKNLDIIIVDDCSEGDCKEIVDSYIEKDHRIKYKRFEKNMGTLIVRKEGALLADGDYTTYIDSDDEFEVDTFNIISETLRYKRTDIIQFKSKVISDDEEKNKELNTWLSTYKVLSKNNLLLDLMHHKIPHNVCSKFYRTLILKKSANYISNIYLINAEDLLQTFIILYFAKSYQSIDKELYVYNYALGISSSINEMTKEKYELLCKTTKQALYECGNFLNKMPDGDLYKLSFANLQYLNYKYMYDILNKVKIEYKKYFSDIIGKYFSINIDNNYDKYKSILEYYNSCDNIVYSHQYQQNIYNEIRAINEEMLPYFFYIIRDDKYLTIYLFGIKISIKKNKAYQHYKIITTSTILRRIFSIRKEQDRLKINILFFQIVIKIKK